MNHARPAGDATTSAPLREPRVRVVGCGQWHRGDDQFGLLVAERLRACTRDQLDVRESAAPGADLLTLVEDVDRLILVDAAVADAHLPIGSLCRIVLHRGDDAGTGDYAMLRRAPRITSGHSLGVGYALALADALEIAPCEVWLYAVGAANFDVGDALTPAVAARIEPAATRILQDLGFCATTKASAADA